MTWIATTSFYHEFEVLSNKSNHITILTARSHWPLLYYISTIAQWYCQSLGISWVLAYVRTSLFSACHCRKCLTSLNDSPHSILHFPVLPLLEFPPQTVARLSISCFEIFSVLLYLPGYMTQSIYPSMIHSHAPLGGRILSSNHRPTVPKPYLSYDPKSGTWETVTYAKNHGKQMASSFGRKSLLCFYCNKRSGIKYDGFITQWECGKCDAMNYLDAVSCLSISLPCSSQTYIYLIARQHHRPSSSYHFRRFAATPRD